MNMLDPFLEIVLSGIRAKKEQTGLTLHLKMEDAEALGKLLQTSASEKSTKKNLKTVGANEKEQNLRKKKG
jgi:hypothetical protein